MTDETPDEPATGPGRPTEYDPSRLDEVTNFCLGGATMDQVAELLGVSTVTVWRWRHKHPEFRNAVRVGKEGADERVERSLFECAVGYRRRALKIMQHEGQVITHEYDEEVGPNPGAAFNWLKNRQPDQWREKVDHKHEGTLTLEQLVAQSGLPAK